MPNVKNWISSCQKQQTQKVNRNSIKNMEPLPDTAPRMLLEFGER